MFENHLTMEDLGADKWPNIILWAAPVMFLLVFIEWGISLYQKKDTYDKKDFLAATTIGLVNVGISALLKVFIFGIALFCWNLVPWKIPATWWSFIACFFAIDFARYWAHRVAHEQRFWWATHITHHNSSKYNFSVSFRLGWTQHIKIIFFVPVMLMGFDPFVFFICHQIAVLYQFWIHTEYITKLPRPIEYFFTTPSHHRVHHASDAHYLDKNYGSTFIIWDRIFGTFMPEGERPNYGITKPVTSYNPIYLNFHEWADIVKDLRKAKNGTEVFQILFGKPGDEVIKNRELREREALEKPTENRASQAPRPILVSNENSLLKKED
ncbi:sterol desaturase family protein [Cyclobacterium xiamenense]|jgi:sterol desaturase/sphingolipid hydroxylase (fatty acid hydroxylase superfamily)|uniref:sterol desaturase family protein n=1 Tax=Cyclobacterium xiamenense TaxID=1297121 RepID=UPI0012B8E2AE|nr:sterol desaturase family protein [Cyclobacterium xiamenense]